MEIACRHKVVVRLDFSAGDFVMRGSHKADIYPTRLLGADLVTEIEGAILVGEERTEVQDLEFSIRHLCRFEDDMRKAGIEIP